MQRQIKGSNSQRTKELNRALILKLISTKSPISRIELSKLTQLSKMSVTNIVNELMEKNLVVETDLSTEDHLETTSAGRTPVMLACNPSKLRSIGVYVSRDKCEAALIDINGRVLFRTSVSFAAIESTDTFIDKVTSQVDRVLSDSHHTIQDIRGIGVASIGPLDIFRGAILEPINFHGLEEIPITESLTTRYGCPVYINNDMNASALAEKYHGVARDNHNFVYVGVTNGVGAGIITNDRLFVGHRGFSGEFGHMSINLDGPLCPCGNKGCLEMYAKIPEIIRHFNDARQLGMTSSLETDATWPDIVEHAKKGDELCLMLIHRLSKYLSVGLVNLANIFDPETIVLGHDIALASELMLPLLNENINRKIYSTKHVNILIQMSQFVDQAPLIGSAALIFDALFDGRIEF